MKLKKSYSVCNLLLGAFIALSAVSCDSLLETELPSLALEEAVYSDPELVRAVANGLYTQNFTNNTIFRHEMPSWLSFIADDADYPNNRAYYNTLYTSKYSPTDATLKVFWEKPYQAILVSNDLLEKLLPVTVIPEEEKNVYIAEAKFFRAYGYFILTYLYGNVPYITSTDIISTTLQGNTPRDVIVAHIIEDLKFAKSALAGSDNPKTKITSTAASALLARAYLYSQEWNDAEREANEVITTSGYELETLDRVFVRSSKESILTVASTFGTYIDRVQWGYFARGSKYAALTGDLLASFDNGDQRETEWTSNLNRLGADDGAIYQNKYKRYSAAVQSEAEDYVIFRLAEQYLIRAEARAQQNRLTEADGAIADLDAIRVRAGLSALSQSLTQGEALLAVEKERRHELFHEEAHRWWDLVRTGRVDAVLSVFPGKQWESFRALLPIPQKEVGNNKNLKQNEGYDKVAP